nr:unnamed protein product [Callosobruchus analis]
MPIADRRSKIKSLYCCFNCLKANHLASDCTGGLCKFCKMKHHSLLHLSSSATQNSSNELSNSESTVQTERSHSNRNNSDSKADPDVVVSTSSKNSKIDNSEILLSTALILVKDSSGKYQTCRALLVSASMSNFITSSCCDKLGLDRSTVNIHVICKNPARIELHCFSDASTKAYGAVVYPRSVDVSGYIQVTLLCSKSKVAPIKMFTKPVLAQLVSKVKEALNISVSMIHSCGPTQPSYLIGLEHHRINFKLS